MKNTDNTLQFTLPKTPLPFTCPRCGGGIPNDEHRGQYPGALSRCDNKTYICSKCGTAEAMEQLALGRPLPMSAWYAGLP
jgi:hypothetical protein